jgi:hypothetical protein
MKTTSHPLSVLRHHVTGAIERGEAQAIAGIPSPHVADNPFPIALTAKLALDNAVTEASAALQKYPRGNMGLTPDSVKASVEFQRDKRAYDQAFQAMRQFNTVFLKTHKKAYREYMLAKRNAR